MGKKHGFCGRKKIAEFLADKPHLEMRIRTEKARYIKLIGDRRENKQMLTVLTPKVKPYPKRREAR